MGRLNEAKLCNFPEIDVFCLVSNEDHSMIKPKTFHVPVVTPYELELGIESFREEKRFRSFASDLFSITYPQVSALMTGTHTIWVVIRVLICRRVSRLWLLKLSNLGKFIVNIGKEF
jgi:Putative diphthamide synthesis protein